MWGREAHHVQLSGAQRQEVERLVRRGRTEQRVAQRGRILLAMQDPHSLVEEVAENLGVARTTVWRVCRRYAEQGLAALVDAPRSGRPRQFPPLGARTN